jgi:hypothetical protein
MIEELLRLLLVGVKLWGMLSERGKTQVADTFVEWLDSVLRDFYRWWNEDPR